MKIQITAITSYGTFESNWGRDVPKERVEAMENMLAKCDNLKYMAIENGSGIHYIPGNVVKNSIIVLKVEEE